MQPTLKAFVVGGGAVGTSIDYHLGNRGWETVLIERDALISGWNWHAAELLPQFNMTYATTHSHTYSMDFYKTLEEETVEKAGLAVVGDLGTAPTEERMGEYRLYASTAESCGGRDVCMKTDENQAKWPDSRNEEVKGALYDHPDGYINPADVTVA